MKKKKEILYYLPFALLLLAELIIHWKIDLNVVGGDDTVFLAYSQEEGFSLIPWLAERYMTWSSRTAIEAVLMLMVNLPAVVWRIADFFVVVIGAAALTRLLERREYREYYSFFVSLVMLALPYTLMSTAGWIATSVNYMWPLAAGLIGLYPIRKYIDGRPVNVPEAVLYTICRTRVQTRLTLLFRRLLAEAMKRVQKNRRLPIFIKTWPIWTREMRSEPHRLPPIWN